MFRRRREINLWSNGLLREHVVACYASHPDRDDVRAVVVFHLDLDLLPKDATARAQAAAAQRGDAFGGSRSSPRFASRWKDPISSIC